MTNNFLNENDFKNLFPEKLLEKPSPRPAAPKPQALPKIPAWKLILKFAGLFVAIFILTYLVINFSALSKQSRYFWDVKIKKGTYQQSLAAPTPAPTPSFDATSSAKLLIPKIGAEAPIVWNVEENQIPGKLLEGVAHSQGTALPGQRGNIFITGHSSYYSWSSSPYKDVFALLEKLAPGDKIYIEYQGTNFIYTVTNTKVVSPKDLSVLEQTSNYNLTLMTCVPVGTNLSRLIISSEQTPR